MGPIQPLHFSEVCGMRVVKSGHPEECEMVCDFSEKGSNHAPRPPGARAPPRVRLRARGRESRRSKVPAMSRSRISRSENEIRDSLSVPPWEVTWSHVSCLPMTPRLTARTPARTPARCDPLRRLFGPRFVAASRCAAWTCGVGLDGGHPGRLAFAPTVATAATWPVAVGLTIRV